MHTKGEWKLVQGASDFTQIGCKKPRYFNIAQAFGENHEDNARLIASAPLLLECCEEALKHLSQFHYRTKITQKNIDILQQAIDTAKGDSHVKNQNR